MIHFDAIRDLITDDAVRVHIGTAQLSNPPTMADFPYVVIGGTMPTDYSGAGIDEPTLADALEAFQADVRLTYAATSPSSMTWLLERVRPALNRQAPTIEGYTCERLRLRSLQPIQPDRDIPLGSGMHPIYAIDETRLIAHHHRSTDA